MLTDVTFKVSVLCTREEQLSPVINDTHVDEVIIESDSFDEKDFDRIISEIHAKGKTAAIALPYVFRNEMKLPAFAGFDYILARTIGEVEMIRDKYPDCSDKIHSDYNLYAMNDAAVDVLKAEDVKRITAPIELNAGELRHLDLSEKEFIIYGHMPMMVSAQCINKNTNGCDRQHKFLILKDRTGREMTAENKCRYCYNVIYNANPMSLAGVWDKVTDLKPDTVRINLSIENEKETADVLNLILRQHKDPEDFTRGHFTRGVE